MCHRGFDDGRTGVRTPTTTRLIGHAAVLTLLLLVLMPLVAVDRGIFISDEGAAIMQMETLVEDGRWQVEYPLAELDPEGRFVPVLYALHDDGQLTPYRARPAFILMGALPYEIAGVWGFTALGVVSVGAASLCAALTARRVDARAAVPALWLTGVGTPLLFHAFTLQAHTWGAALVAAVGLLTTRWLQGDAARVWLLAPLVATGVLVRREVLLLAAALAIALAIDAYLRRRPRALVPASLAVLGAAIGLVVNRVITQVVPALDSTLSSPLRSQGDTSFLEGRIVSAWTTLLGTSYGYDNLVDAALLGTVVLAVAGVVLLRRSDDAALLLIALGSVPLVVILRVVLPGEHAGVIPSLIVTSPLLVVGLGMVPASVWTTSEARVLALTSGMFALGVLATQYGNAGAWEWGARFLAVGLPLVTPLAAIGLVAAVDAAPRPSARALTALTLAAAVAMAALALGSQRDARLRAETFVDEVAAAAGPGGLIISTEGAAGRFDAEQFDDDADRVWAAVGPIDLDEFLPLAAAAGYDEPELVSTRRDDLARWVPDGWTLAPGDRLPTLWTPLQLWTLTRVAPDDE